MSTCSVENCKNECFEQEDKCILHCEKDNAYQIDDNNSELFYYALIDYITSKVLRASKEYKTSIDPMENQKTIIWNYFDNIDNNNSSFDLKEALKNKITLEDIIFPIYNSIDNEYNYVSILNKLTNIEFKNCNFKYKIYLKSDKNLIFRECTFSGNWYHIFCKEIKYIECKFDNFVINNISEDKLIVENHLLYNCGFKNIRCSGTIFKKRFFKFDNINKYKKIENIKLINCEFDEDFILNITDNENKKDLEYFEITNINFEHSIFHRKVKIQFCTIKEKASFFNTSFKDLADFYRTKFNEVSFEDSIFEAGVAFIKCKFKDKTNFTYTSFEDKTFFNKAKFSKKINLETATFYKDVDFLKIKTEVANRETARKIKDSFEKQNNIIEANKFYALEMKEREKELAKDIKSGKNIVDWLIFKAHAISSNHSQDWLLALFWIIIFGALYTIVSFCSSNTCLSNVNTPILIGSIFLVSFYSLHVYNMRDYKQFTKYIFLFLLFVNYFTLTKDFNLSCLADKINPFSIMTSEESITFGLLMFKITIAYLIYQFIVSVRQNTRRK